jgi:hypothetical protein
MGVRSHFRRRQDVVELRETTTSQAQVTSTFRHRSDSIEPIQHVAPVFEPEILPPRENVHPRVEHITTILEGEAQLPSTATSEAPSRTRPPTLHGKDGTPTSQPSSALGENDYLRPTTPIFSNRASIYPTGDFRNSSMPDINDMKTEIMCNYLHQQQLKKMWSNGSHEEGVLLKKSKDDYTCCPPDLQLQRNGLFDAVKKLNVRVCRYA